MTKTINPEKQKKIYYLTSVICILVLSAVTVVCSSLLRIPSRTQYSYYYKSVQAGTIADETIYVKNTVDLINEEATLQRIERAQKAVLPVFSFDSKAVLESIKNFENFKNKSVFDQNVLLCSYNIITDILNRGFFDSKELDELKSHGYTFLFVNNSFSEKFNASGNRNIDEALSKDNLGNFIDVYLAEYGDYFSEEDRENIKLIVSSFVQPNIFYDDVITQEKRNQVTENTQPVIVSLKKGDILIEKDKVVTSDQINILKILTSKNSVSPKLLIGIFVFCVICYSTVILVFGFFSKEIRFGMTRNMIILTVALIINLVACYFCAIYASQYFTFDLNESFMPIIFVPMFITVMSTKKRLGFCASALIGISLTVFPGSSLYSFFYVCICGCSCVFLTQIVTRRIESIKQWFITLLVCIAFTALFIFIGSFSFKNMISEFIGVAAMVTASNLLITIFMPILEKILNIPTVYRLHELAFADSPLLTRLAQAAPGTYEHSRRVSELSAYAAKQIGANSLMARVGGLYHDIGKTEHPEYFVENQQGGDNKHNDINPSLSASILKNHVSVGADKARDAHLPSEIVNIIANHHGNDLIYYFYHEALKSQTENAEEVQAQDYSYNNSEIPNSKECAIVMLADSVEAAARTVVAPTPAKFTKLIHSIVLGKIERNQLTDSMLSMGEIKVIEDSFLRTLNAQYHSRIEYSDEEDD